jgi:hypothetical protein
MKINPERSRTINPQAGRAVNFVIAFLYFMLYAFYSMLTVRWTVFADNAEQLAVAYSGEAYESPFKPCLPQKGIVISPGSVKPETPIPSLSLEGIVWGGIFPQAIINGSIVKEGDKISDAEVLKIEKNEIKLSYQGNIFFLKSHETNADALDNIEGNRRNE